MKYKSAFTPEQWDGMQTTWEIVEERARDTERKEIKPLEDALKEGSRRRTLAKEIEQLSKEFIQEFDSIYDDTKALFDAANEFISKYEYLEDTSKSFKKHKVLDTLGKELRKQLTSILRGKDDSQSGTTD